MYRHHLETLDEDASKILFRIRHGWGAQQLESPQLAEMEQDLLDACGGLPSALIALGSSLDELKDCLKYLPAHDIWKVGFMLIFCSPRQLVDTTSHSAAATCL